MKPPSSRRIVHTVPSFVSGGDIFFITICSNPRGTNQLACMVTWSQLQASAAHFHDIGRWHIRLLLAMPDHIHLLAAFPAGESMKRVVAAWKHFTSRSCGIPWQRDFFDHRLRAHESLEQKSVYIRENPIRAGLMTHSGTWPYVWSPEATATPE